MANNKLQLRIRSDAAMEAIKGTLGTSERAQALASNLLSLANSNPLLQLCDADEVIKCGLRASAMRLSLDPNMGEAYIIPYKNSRRSKEAGMDVYDAQYQVGYKGFVQLALRSREYKTINVTDIREGEFKGLDRMSGEYEFEFIQDETERRKRKVIGYAAYFKLHGGFDKILYMSNAELTAHGKRYSKSFAKGYGNWADDFDGMARKTVIKLLISHWGPKSVELVEALRADQAAMADEDSYNYLDNDKDNGKSEEKPANRRKTKAKEDTPEAETVGDD